MKNNNEKSSVECNIPETRQWSKILAQGVLINSSTCSALKIPEDYEHPIDKLDILGGYFPILENNIDTTSFVTQEEVDSFNKEIDEFNKEVNNIVFVDPDNKALVDKIINSFKIV